MPKRNVVVAALVVMILLLAQSLAAQIGATYYVSTSGNDSNPGTHRLALAHHPARGEYSQGGRHGVRLRRSLQRVCELSRVWNGIGADHIPKLSRPDCGDRRHRRSCCGSSGTQGLINITGSRSYITINGFEIRNYTTSSDNDVPSGVWITGSGTGIQILNNRVHNITTKSETNGNAFGIAVYGTSKTPITQLVISGNEVYDLRTGKSESVNVDGNVTHFQDHQ